MQGGHKQSLHITYLAYQFNSSVIMITVASIIMTVQWHEHIISECTV